MINGLESSITFNRTRGRERGERERESVKKIAEIIVSRTTMHVLERVNNWPRVLSFVLNNAISRVRARTI